MPHLLLWQQLPLLIGQPEFVHLVRQLEHLVRPGLSVLAPDVQPSDVIRFRRQRLEQERKTVSIFKGLVGSLSSSRRNGVRGVAHDDDSAGRARRRCQFWHSMKWPNSNGVRVGTANLLLRRVNEIRSRRHVALAHLDELHLVHRQIVPA